MAKLTHKRYEIRDEVELELGREDDGALSFYGIFSHDPVENESLGESGDYSCWDADVTFVKGGIQIVGADGPSGGNKTVVTLFVPQSKIVKLTITPA